MSLRDDILSYAASQGPALLPVSTPEIPDQDGQVYAKRLSPRSAAALYDEAEPGEAQLDERARLVVRGACDQSGNLIFGDGDVLTLSTSDYLAPMVIRLYWAILAWSGMTSENREAWRKNLPATGGVGSPSSSSAPCQASPSDSDTTSSGS
jgi:hypothetical protein